MAATELKRYQITPDGWEQFLEVWRRIVTVRRRHGFGIKFAFADREQNMFTWAIDHDGDFDAAAKAYYEDPERIELEIVERYVTGFEIRKVEVLDLP
ncbi:MULTISPECIES: hypothetical protein [unclassified Sphingomonas]|uniref:hypothetical protein n=1 Tax=unclassified Sphingomonas TaxID=196159 RepID=UPI0006F82B2D|nr:MULTISPECIES: hypothetical protein [unclassified Sphingomonas]KQX23534.1 hypothetical protein ASD17_04390 [Sphingomonas sp. Root1294]KQY68384.1 hypothetical protein ASD39_06910 [Sphingomonas sp. Root50]KRB91287.1 hypothetical protein ASE22_13720 [Sphingomonas sp. Root720]